MPLDRQWELCILQDFRFPLLQVLSVLLSHEITVVLANFFFCSCLETLNI